MAMYNPPHPSEFIASAYLESNGVNGVSPKMALRFSKCLGRSPESWLAMQHSHDLWQAKRSVDLRDVETLNVTAA